MGRNLRKEVRGISYEQLKSLQTKNNWKTVFGFVTPCWIGANVPTFQLKQINQPDATVWQVYYLTLMFRSTCFGRIIGQTTTNNAATATLQR
jgi:hypothetical protein